MRALRAARSAVGPWELFLVAVIIVICAVGVGSSPYFLTGSNLSIALSEVMEIGVMAMAMMLLVLVGEIDLSVASVLGLCSVVCGLATGAGLPLTATVVLVLATGVIAGTVNALLVTVVGIPSIVVTIGTLGLFRGLAYGIYGSRSQSTFPSVLIDLGNGTVPGTGVPWSVVLFIVIAAGVGTVLHLRTSGRRLFAIGLNRDAAAFSGVRTGRILFALFVLSGLLAAVAALIYTGRLSAARADNAVGLELQVVAVVLLGGVSIHGGSGSLLGVLLSVVAIAALRNVFVLNNADSSLQLLVVGVLMVAAVVLPKAALRAQSRWVSSRGATGRGPS